MPSNSSRRNQRERPRLHPFPSFSLFSATFPSAAGASPRLVPPTQPSSCPLCVASALLLPRARPPGARRDCHRDHIQDTTFSRRLTVPAAGKCRANAGPIAFGLWAPRWRASNTPSRAPFTPSPACGGVAESGIAHKHLQPACMWHQMHSARKSRAPAEGYAPPRVRADCPAQLAACTRP